MSDLSEQMQEFTEHVERIHADTGDYVTLEVRLHSGGTKKFNVYTSLIGHNEHNNPQDFREFLLKVSRDGESPVRAEFLREKLKEEEERREMAEDRIGDIRAELDALG